MVVNQDFQNDRLIIFGRYPVPGRTKTRLIPALGPAGAAELQRQLTEKAITTARAFTQSRGIDLDFHFEGGNTKKMFQWLGSGMIFSQQEPGDLGERMHAAFLKSFQSGLRRVVLVGTDIPGLSIDFLRKAFDALSRHDIVIGPATDGGYWLIGMKRPFNLFQDIDWGTETVFAQTIFLTKKEGLRVCLLDPLTDIDTGKDLKGLSPDFIRRRPYISIIIPTLNEEDIIESTIHRAQNRDTEIIVVDGGSTDGTVARAAATGARVVTAPCSRANHQNRGAELAAGRVLLFLHADTHLPDDYMRHIFETMLDPMTATGAFRFKTDLESPFMKAIEFLTNIRSIYFKMPYGDQGIFIRKSLFESVGGFPDIPIMEDFEFMRRIKKKGKVIILPVSVITSGRRWLNLGVIKTTIINQIVIAAYFMGVSPAKIALCYQNKRRRVNYDYNKN